MHSSTASSPNSTPSHDSFSSIQLPLETRPDDPEKTVQQLKQRPTDDLKRARKHHRRALRALQDGAYDALPEETRTQLIKRLRGNLRALNKALEASTRTANPSTKKTRSTASSSLFQKALTWLW